MKKMSIRIISIALSFIMFFAMTPVIGSQAADKKLKDKTIYMQTYSYVLKVNGITSIKGLSCSNRKVLVPESFCLRSDSYADTWLDDNGITTTDSPGADKYAYLYFSPKNTGTSKITFTSGKKNYTQKVTVKKYVNPLKKLTISGVNEGKNIKDLFKDTNSIETDTTSVKTRKLTAKAASGWRITQIKLSNKISYDNSGDEIVASGTYSIPRTSASVAICDYDSTHYGYADITLRNKKNKGEIIISVALKPSK